MFLLICIIWNCLEETRIKEETAEDEIEEVEANIFTDIIEEEEEKILLEENIPAFTFTIEENSTQVRIGASLNQCLGSGSLGSFWLSWSGLSGPKKKKKQLKTVK